MNYLNENKSYFLGVLHHLTARSCLKKLLLWCTKSKAFLHNKNQKHSLNWKLWKKKHHVQYFQYISEVIFFLFFQNFHYTFSVFYVCFFISKAKLGNEHCFFNLDDFFNNQFKFFFNLNAFLVYGILKKIKNYFFFKFCSKSTHILGFSLGVVLPSRLDKWQFGILVWPKKITNSLQYILEVFFSHLKFCIEIRPKTLSLTKNNEKNASFKRCFSSLFCCWQNCTFPTKVSYQGYDILDLL